MSGGDRSYLEQFHGNKLIVCIYSWHLQVPLTCALGLDGGVCACPAGVIPCPGVVVAPATPCTPELRARLDGGTMAAPGGGEVVPVGGEEVPVF